MSLQARAILWLLLVVGILAGWHRLTAHYDHQGYRRAQVEYEQRAELQRESNRGRARQVEEKHAAQAEVREKFIVTTVTEIRHETDNLAACVLTEPARQRLRNAAQCASEDRSASCGAGDGVRPPK